MLHRLILSFAFALLFAMGQQGAIVHEISHFAHLAPQSQQQDKAPHSAVCDKCLSYAGLGAALAADNYSLPVLATVLAPASQQGAQPPHPAQHYYAARAPPTLA